MSDSDVYVTENFSEPMGAQHEFAHDFNMTDPAEAMSVYARIMHEHTKKQLSTATNSARRRSQGVAAESPSGFLGSVSSPTP